MTPKAMRSLLIVLVFAAGFPGSLAAQSGAEHFFQQGNQAYRDGNFQEALNNYRRILDSGFESSRIYYNMGNCYYKLNAIGPAVLYYEKALRLDPHDEEIRLNLQLANLRVVDRIDMPPQFFLFQWWDKLKTFLPIDQLSAATAALYSLTMLLLIAHLFLRDRRSGKWSRGLLIIFATLTVFLAYLLYLNVADNTRHREAVVLAQSVNVLSAPEENGTDVFVLHEGIKVQLNEQRGDWLRISLPDGKSGWLKQDRVGMI